MRLHTLLSITVSVMLLGSAAQAGDFMNSTHDSRSLSVPDSHLGGIGGSSLGGGNNDNFHGTVRAGGGSVATIGSSGGAGVAPKPATPKTLPVAVMPAVPKPVVAQPAKPTMPVQRELTTGHYDTSTRPAIQPVKSIATAPVQDRVTTQPVAVSPTSATRTQAAYERASEARAAYVNAHESGASRATLNQLHGEFEQSTRAYEEVRAGGSAAHEANVTSESLLAKHQNSLTPMAPQAAKAALKARSSAATAERKARFEAWDRAQSAKLRAILGQLRNQR